MKFQVYEGPCGVSLNKTCLYIGIVFIILGIASVGTGALWSSAVYISAMDGVVILTNICLIIAATCVENKWLCVPWIIGYIISLVLFVLVLLTEVLGMFNNNGSGNSTGSNAIIRLVIYILMFVLETIALRYVYSYYKLLGASTPISGSPVKQQSPPKEAQPTGSPPKGSPEKKEKKSPEKKEKTSPEKKEKKSPPKSAKKDDKKEEE